MFFRSFKLYLAGLMTALLLVACGTGESAPAPTGLTASAGESSATLTWDMVSGVEYWVFYAPTSVSPSSVTSMQNWFGLPGGNVMLKVSSPYVVQGLANGVNYSFSINGRISGGPGGPGATPVQASPRIAGSNWTATAASGSVDLRSVAYGSTTSTTLINSVTTTTNLTTTYIAVGDLGAMYSSTDGTNWTPIDYANTKRLSGASFLSTYKVVGDEGLILTSPDTITWTVQTSGTTKNLYAIAGNGLNLNVAVGAAGTIITSTDGLNWTAASSSGTVRDLYAVNYGGGTWVAVGAGGTIVVSGDGLTWHAVDSGESNDLRGIASMASLSSTGTLNTTYVAVGAASTLLSSSDAGTWTQQPVPMVGANLNAVVYGTQFVAVGAEGSILFSSDGLIWEAAQALNSKEILAVTHGLDGFYAVGSAGSHLQSK